MDYGAQTEYGRLRKVLMHRPTEELKRITPGNKDAYLFRDVAYWREPHLFGGYVVCIVYWYHS